MEFDVFTTTVDLQDIPSYTTSIILEGQLLRLSLLWNERVGKRVLSIKNSNDEYYLQNTILHPNEPFELNSNAVFDDLPYKVVLQKVGDTNKVGNIYNWSKDFILCFYRTVDVETEKLNVKYGVTAPSTPILPKPFGNWILNQGFNIATNNIRYTGYKTNGVSYYDSFANFDLVTALVRSFHDSDLQQYVAFTTAVEQLIGDVDWVLDPANNQIRYTLYLVDDGYLWTYPDNQTKYGSAQQACQAYSAANGRYYAAVEVNGYGTAARCYHSDSKDSPYLASINLTAVENEEENQRTIPLPTVAQQVISNADSSADEVLKLLSEDYINLVANSVFDSNPSKQFVKLEDLIPQLEANKVLR